MAWQDRAYNREDSGRGWGGLSFLLPPTPLATALMVSCFVIFLAQAFTGPSAGGSLLVRHGALVFADNLAFVQPWRWFSYQYLHGGALHLFFNLLTIYFFVPMLERRWGWRRTFAFYTAGGIAAGVTYGLMSLALGMGSAPLVGASGALLAILGAIAVIAPDMQVLLIFIPVTMRVLAILYAILYMLSIAGDRNTADAAHLSGLAFGAAAVYFFGPAFNRFAAKRGWDFTPAYEDGGFSDTFRPDPRYPRLNAGAIRRARKLEKQEQAEQLRIDQILAKVSASGMHSLTWIEKRTLKKATEHQRQRDAELSRTRRGR